MERVRGFASRVHGILLATESAAEAGLTWRWLSVPADSGDDELNSTINTTPLVDVMLVLLIIFLITMPVITKTVPVELPAEINIPTQTKPENIVIAIDQERQHVLE